MTRPYFGAKSARTRQVSKKNFKIPYFHFRRGFAAQSWDGICAGRGTWSTCAIRPGRQCGRGAARGRFRGGAPGLQGRLRGTQPGRDFFWSREVDFRGSAPGRPTLTVGHSGGRPGGLSGRVPGTGKRSTTVMIGRLGGRSRALPGSVPGDVTYNRPRP